MRDSVSSLIRQVAATAVMPRFCALAASEVSEKSPGEIVTRADEEAEAMLTEGLARLDRSARIVGEEAAARDPAMLVRVGEGRVWLIDPLDGTGNFAAGRRPFGIMVALIEDGEPIAGWMYDPVSRRLCHAARGKGATVNGVPVRAREGGGVLPVAALATQFMSPIQRQRVHRHAARSFDLVPIPRCAAEHYPRLAGGENDIALFQRTLPWDHAPGALFLCEAGGAVARWDGSAYRIGDGKTGLIAASSARRLETAARVLFDGRSGLEAGCAPAVLAAA